MKKLLIILVLFLAGISCAAQTVYASYSNISAVNSNGQVVYFSHVYIENQSVKGPIITVTFRDKEGRVYTISGSNIYIENVRVPVTTVYYGYPYTYYRNDWYYRDHHWNYSPHRGHHYNPPKPQPPHGGPRPGNHGPKPGGPHGHSGGHGPGPRR